MHSDEQLIDRRLTIRWGPQETEVFEKDNSNGGTHDVSGAEMASLHGNSVRDGGCERVAGVHGALPCRHNTVLTQCDRVKPPVQAAKRRAITELLFFACVGDIKRCQRIVKLWNLNVRWGAGLLLGLTLPGLAWHPVPSAWLCAGGMIVQLPRPFRCVPGAGGGPRLLRLR